MELDSINTHSKTRNTTADLEDLNLILEEGDSRLLNTTERSVAPTESAIFRNNTEESNGEENNTEESAGGEETSSSTNNTEESSDDSTGYRHCSADDLNNGTIIPCSKYEDPFSDTRDIIEDLFYGGQEGVPYSDAYESRRIFWSSLASRNKKEAVKVLNGDATIVSKNLVVKKRFVGAIGLKVVKAIASVAQVCTVAKRIVTNFLPDKQSPELKEIRARFSQTNAALDALSFKLDQLEGKSDFKAILPKLTNFKASVDLGMKKYNKIAKYFKNRDVTSEAKKWLEDLINYVGNSGNIEQQLQLMTDYILEGTDMAFINADKRLISTFRRAEDNDCSKIIPFGVKLLTLIQNAQTLQFFYELNQGLVSVTDDKGYPRDMYNIYVEIVEQYADCSKTVAKYLTTKELCHKGKVIYQPSDESLQPFCLCDFGYGGDKCDISLIGNPNESLISSMLDISQKYKVPGLSDLEDQIHAQTDKIMNSLQESKQEILTEMRSGQQKNKNTVLAAQSLILNQMKTETSRVFGGFTNLKRFFEAALEKERYDRIKWSEKTTSQIVYSIVEVAQQITDSLVSLDKKTVENRYFDELSLHIPVFQRLFEYASSCKSSEHMKEMFSHYLKLNKHYFYVAREALTHAVIGRPDSYLRAHMRGFMTSGCTEEYNEQVKATWEMLLDLHSSTYVMEYWDMFYRRNRALSNKDYDEIIAIDEEKIYLDAQSMMETNLLTREHSLSCPSFIMSEIVGGGCKDGSVFWGQTVKRIKCNDENKNIILGSSGATAEEITCQDNGKWNVNITDLKCVQSCSYDGSNFAIGESRKLPLPNSGYVWVNSEKNVVTESECVYDSLSSTVGWSHYEEEDIDECSSGKDLCGSHGSCVNTNGSYACYCEPGFVFNPGSGCEDINECTAGERGAISCMVSQQLGVCNNTEGSFECICLVGAYKSSNSSEDEECSPCPCHEDGVTMGTCNVKTGECYCRDEVRKEDCSACKVGHFDFPTCRKCEMCNTKGTTDEICDPEDGSCLCNSLTYGKHCDRCCPDLNCEDDYKEFPDCTPIVRHGILSSWSSWSGWSDLGSCTGNDAYGYYQKRTRRRSCDDSNRTRHGKSCKHDKLQDEETRYRSVCKYVTGYAVKISCRWFAGTWGNIQFGIRQNGVECHSYRNTISGVSRCSWYTRSGRQGCNKRFDTTKPVQIRILNDSRNNAYVDYFDVSIDGSDRYWRGHEKMIDKNTGSSWHSAYSG